MFLDFFSMLREYGKDRLMGMDVDEVSECIYEYTSGYPFLVSYICKCLDGELPGSEGFERAEDAWTKKALLRR